MTQINTAKSDPKNTWRLINELTSRKTSVNSNVKAIKHEVVTFTNSVDIANTFNILLYNDRWQPCQQNTLFRYQSYILY